MTASGPLRANASVTCTYLVEDEDEDLVQCGGLSRFVVSRSDGDTTFGIGGGTEETCERHLAETALGMVGGYANVTAIVTIRWDSEDDAS